MGKLKAGYLQVGYFILIWGAYLAVFELEAKAKIAKQVVIDQVLIILDQLLQ